ncbi:MULTISPECIES: hypothetical protein [unclassified Carboxylicivirga]|uniref:hypothetical protein n=1 Tax=Carboxylicivirga TaxID=1628153 RepID=UPI003D3553A3
MKNNWFIYIGLVASLLLTGCESEDMLTPSNMDKNRVSDFVNSTDKQFVKSIYEKFNCGLLYEYDAVLDFAYTAANSDASEKWAKIELSMIQDAYLDENGNMPAESKDQYNLHVDKALTFIDTTIFKYISDDALMAQKMPFKVLVCNIIETPTEVKGNNVFTESDSRIGEQAIGVLNCLYNEHSIAISTNQDALLYNSEQYRRDNFYIFLCRIMEMHDLYAYIPEAFYAMSSENYGRLIETVYAEEFGIDLEDDSEGAETVPDVVSKDWFYSKGFIDARYFYNGTIGLTTIDGEPKAIKKKYVFVQDMKADVRSYLNEMLHRNEAELLAFPDSIKSKMLILMNLMEEWGVDLKAFNPDLEIVRVG